MLLYFIQFFITKKLYKYLLYIIPQNFNFDLNVVVIVARWAKLEIANEEERSSFCRIMEQVQGIEII